MMTVRIFLPTDILLEQEGVARLHAEGAEGCFTLLPRHIDYVAMLVPGILTLEDQAGEQRHVAVDEGCLVKVGREVRISTRNGVAGTDIETLAEVVKRQFKQVDEQEKRARAILTGLEYSVLKRFSELKHPG